MTKVKIILKIFRIPYILQDLHLSVHRSKSELKFCTHTNKSVHLANTAQPTTIVISTRMQLGNCMQSVEKTMNKTTFMQQKLCNVSQVLNQHLKCGLFFKKNY